MPIIYVSQRGRVVKNYSLSQADASSFCPQKNALQRIVGLQQKGTSANLPFGRVVESGLRHMHQTGMDPVPAVVDFMRKELAEFKDLDFKAKWSNPESLVKAAQDCMRLYKLRKDSVGIVNPTFYTYEERVVKEKFLDDSGFELVPDIIDWPREHPKFGGGARIIDVKCLGSSIDTKYDGIASLDKQLNVYAHFLGIERVALLAFKFGSPEPPDKGDYRVCMTDVKNLAGEVVLAAGTKVRHSDAVAGGDEKTNKKMREEAKKSGLVWVSTPTLPCAIAVSTTVLSNVEMHLIEGRVNLKAAEATVKLLRSQAQQDANRWVEYSEILRELDLRKDLLTYEEYQAEKKLALVRAYPRNPGIRFPDQRCTWCCMIGECLDRPDVSKQLVSIQDDRWLEEL